MIWGAHQADGRIAANNAKKIRAALGLEINAAKVFERYQQTQPAVTDNIAQDRARARAWAMLNVGLNLDALGEVLARLWAEGVVTGYAAADEAVRRAREALKAGESDYIDWSNWKPGDEAAAALIRPKGTLKRLLDGAGTRISMMSKESYEQIGTALADSLAVGLSAERAAKLINNTVRNPKRALTIANTELNRAMSAATLERYKAYEVEKIEWAVSDPCKLCAPNAGQVITMGGSFQTGVQQPPAHPNCRCALLPVIDDEATSAAGVRDIAPDLPDLGDLAEEPTMTRRFEAGRDDELYSALRDDQRRYIESLTEKQLKAIQTYQGLEYEDINDGLRRKKPLSADNKNLIKELDRVIDKADLQYNTTVYRGVIDDKGVFDTVRIGDTLKDPGYLSTSPNPAVAEAFANGTLIDGKPIVLEIDVPMGQPALASDLASARLANDIEEGLTVRLDDDDMIAELGGYVRLNEVTLPRNLPLEVIEIIDKENAKYIRVRIKK
jgi:SPP1 gp7 family putative phage head morphogenesis protein